MYLLTTTRNRVCHCPRLRLFCVPCGCQSRGGGVNNTEDLCEHITPSTNATTRMRCLHSNSFHTRTADPRHPPSVSNRWPHGPTPNPMQRARLFTGIFTRPLSHRIAHDSEDSAQNYSKTTTRAANGIHSCCTNGRRYWPFASRLPRFSC